MVYLHKKTKKFAALSMAATMIMTAVFTLAPMSDVKASESSGTHYGINWTLDANGLLTLSGTGYSDSPAGTKWDANAVKAVTTNGTVTINGRAGSVGKSEEGYSGPGGAGSDASMVNWFSNNKNLESVSGTFTLNGGIGGAGGAVYQASVNPGISGGKGGKGGQASTASMFSGCTKLSSVTATFNLTGGNGGAGQAASNGNTTYFNVGGFGGDGGDGGNVVTTSMFDGCTSLTNNKAVFKLVSGTGGAAGRGGNGAEGGNNVGANGGDGQTGGDGGSGGAIDTSSMYKNCTSLIDSTVTCSFACGSGANGAIGGTGGRGVNLTQSGSTLSGFGGKGGYGGDGGNGGLNVNLSSMFNGCSNLKSFNGAFTFTPGTCGTKAAGGSGAYGPSGTGRDGSEGKNGSVKTANVSSMFSNCSNLRNVNLGSFKADYISSSDGMFANCCSVTQITTPTSIGSHYISLYETMYDVQGNAYSKINKGNIILSLPKYFINYNLNGGVANNPSYALSSKSTTLTNPTKTGYDFVGWSDGVSADKNMEVVIPSGTEGDINYVANWEIINYSLDYNYNDGIADNPATYNIESEDFVLNNPTKEGYNFIGWTHDCIGDSLDDMMMDVVVYASSMEDKSFTAHYMTRSLTLDNGEDDECKLELSDDKDALLPNQVDVPVHNNKIFTGYYDSDDVMYYDESGNKVKDWDKIDTTNDEEILYAKYESVPEADNNTTDNNNDTGNGSNGNDTTGGNNGGTNNSTGNNGRTNNSTGNNDSTNNSTGDSGDTNNSTDDSGDTNNSTDDLGGGNSSEGNTGSGDNDNNEPLSYNVISIDKENNTATVRDEVIGENVVVSLSYITKGDVYRMYDPNRGEHFYTKDIDEMKYLKKVGWNHEENADFVVVSALDDQSIAVYRLYNPNNGGMHFYTEDAKEVKQLIYAGWKYEGISHYVYNASAKQGMSQYRLYNPNSLNGEHNWTADVDEYKMLKKVGWIDEGIRWEIAG